MFMPGACVRTDMLKPPIVRTVGGFVVFAGRAPITWRRTHGLAFQDEVDSRVAKHVFKAYGAEPQAAVSVLKLEGESA